MKTCTFASEQCFGEVQNYEYRVGTAAEIAEEDAQSVGSYKRGLVTYGDFCEFHKRGKLYVYKPVRPSLPYQGIARRALLTKKDSDET